MLAILGMGYLPDLSFSAEYPPNIYPSVSECHRADQSSLTVRRVLLLSGLCSTFTSSSMYLLCILKVIFFYSHSLVFGSFLRISRLYPRCKFCLYSSHLYSGSLINRSALFFSRKKNDHYLVFIRLNCGETSTKQTRW